MDPQVAMLLATSIGGLLAGAGTLGATWLNNRHAAKLAEKTREQEDARWQTERRDVQAESARQRRQAAWRVVQDALIRAAEARMVCEALVTESQDLIRRRNASQTGPMAAQYASETKDVRDRMASNIAEFSKIAAALSPHGDPLRTDARSLEGVVREVYSKGSSESLAKLSTEMQYFQATLGEWLEEHRE